MTMKPPPDIIRDSTIADLHKLRRKLVAKFKGDLSALTLDARKRQNESGRIILRQSPLRKIK